MLVRFIKSGKIKDTNAGELFIRIGIAEEVKTENVKTENVKTEEVVPASLKTPKKESKRTKKPAKRGRPRKK